MFTLAHPLAPTVTYRCDLPKAIASYATDHLCEYDVFPVEVEGSTHGVGIEVIDKSSDTHLGFVTIN